MLPLITLEEHYVSPTVRAAQTHDEFATFPPDLVRKLNSLDNERIDDMDKGKVSLQPDSLIFQWAIRPPQQLSLSACIRQLGFVGALVDNHLNGTFYDNENFWPIFEQAQTLDVPIYIHPYWAADSALEHYRGNYEESVAVALSAYGWGWHSETGLHILKLYASGLFDRFPRLKIIIGHMGEMLPFQLERVIKVSGRWGKTRGFEEVWRENIWITTSGMFSLPPLACLLQTTSIDHVLYSVDYPFSSNETGLAFFDQVKESGLITGEDLEKFAFRNAKALLRVRAEAQ